MARPKEVYGKKLIYRYSAGVIFTILFSLMAIACYVLSLFMPFLTYQEVVGENISINGLDFIKLFISLFTGEAHPVFDNLRNHITNNIFDGFGVANGVINVMFYEMAIILMIMGIITFILIIGTLVLIFSGRLKHWKLPYSMTKRIFIWSFSYYALIIGINIYSMVAHKAYVYDAIYSIIFFATLFVLTIVIHIIYLVDFKNHVYVKNLETLNRYKEDYERQHLVTYVPQPIAAKKPEVEEPRYEPSDDKRYLPRGLKTLGKHAFKQNVDLEVADIPLGIAEIGAGAFANCINLRDVNIPETVKKINYNAFFNCIRLRRINYGGTKEMWRKVKRGSNWLSSSGTKTVFCIDGSLIVDPEK